MPRDPAADPAACRCVPRTGHIGTIGPPIPSKETEVAAPIAAVRNWLIEQVTAISSVTRPIHTPSRSIR